MAPGNQTWNGTWADFVAAPTRTSTAASVPEPPPIGSKSEITDVPDVFAKTIRPASRTRPPPPVIISARLAAVSTEGSLFLCPTNRNDVIEVSSQKMNSVQTESAHTRPSIDVENANNEAAKRLPPAAVGEK